jgi:hypothetical protein
MAPECWFCGKPIRRNERAESLRGSVAVHAKCVERDVAGSGNRPIHDTLRKAA